MSHTQELMSGDELKLRSVNFVSKSVRICSLSSDNQEKLKSLTSEADFKLLGVTAVLFPLIIEVMNFLPYGNVIRVMFIMAFLTGCRLRELDIMAMNGPNNFIKGSRIFWEVGKNQTGTRSKELPYSFIEELLYYRQTHRVPDNKLFGINSETFLRYFTKDVRPKLSAFWHIKEVCPKKSGVHEYKFKLKGLRKSFSTLYFANAYYLKWEKDATAALMDTSKELKHSTEYMTAYHYLNEFELLDIKTWLGMSPADIYALANQKHLPEFAVGLDWNKLKHENWQLRLQDF